MKLAHAALAAIAGASWCVGLFAQRTADFGFGDDDSPTQRESGVLLVAAGVLVQYGQHRGIRASRLGQIAGRAITRKPTGSF